MVLLDVRFSSTLSTPYQEIELYLRCTVKSRQYGKKLHCKNECLFTASAVSSTVTCSSQNVRNIVITTKLTQKTNSWILATESREVILCYLFVQFISTSILLLITFLPVHAENWKRVPVFFKGCGYEQPHYPDMYWQRFYHIQTCSLIASVSGIATISSFLSPCMGDSQSSLFSLIPFRNFPLTKLREQAQVQLCPAQTGGSSGEVWPCPLIRFWNIWIVIV